MKKITLTLLSFLFCSCAKTVFYQNGKTIAKFHGDMEQVEYRQNADGSIVWSAFSVDHSSATEAQGKAFANKAAAARSAIAASGATAILLR